MISETLNLILADDDEDDCLLFKEVLDELNDFVHLTTVHDGIQLMQLLSNESAELPFALFLDLNMPRKNGFESLYAIKLNEKLRHLPVIIFSTSINQEVVDQVYKSKANYFICKPNDYTLLKKVILKALTLLKIEHRVQPSRENFVLTI